LINMRAVDDNAFELLGFKCTWRIC
jgi:hypothetical protein